MAFYFLVTHMHSYREMPWHSGQLLPHIPPTASPWDSHLAICTWGVLLILSFSLSRIWREPFVPSFFFFCECRLYLPVLTCRATEVPLGYLIYRSQLPTAAPPLDQKKKNSSTTTYHTVHTAFVFHTHSSTILARPAPILCLFFRQLHVLAHGSVQSR